MTDIRTSPSGPLVSVDEQITTDDVINTSDMPPPGGTLTEVLDALQLPEETAAARATGTGTGPPVPQTIHEMLDWIAAGALWVFDGINDYISMGNQVSLGFEFNIPFSVSGWFRSISTDPSTVGVIAAKENSAGRGWAMFIDQTGNCFFHLFNTFPTNGLSNRTGPGFNDGARHHMVATYDGSRTPGGLLIYIDGVLQATTNVTNSLSATIANTGIFALGAGLDATANFIQGTDQEVSTWTRVLTLAEVTSLYNGGDPPNVANLSFFSVCNGYWKVNGADTVGAGGIHDYSTGAHNGTAQNGLAPTTEEGVMLVRGPTKWDLVVPFIAGLPLVANGPNAEPSFQPLAVVVNPYKPSYFEDFDGGGDAVAGVASGIIGASGWSANFTGTAGTVARTDAAQRSTNPGIYRITGGGTNGNQQAVFKGLVSGSDVIDGQQIDFVEFLIYLQFSAAQAQEIAVGIATDPLGASSGTDAVLFSMDPAVWGNTITFIVRTSSTNVDVIDTLVPVQSASAIAFRLRITYNTVTAKYGYVVQRAASRAVSGSQVNAPATGMMNPFCRTVTQGGAKAVDLDYCNIKMQTTTRGL